MKIKALLLSALLALTMFMPACSPKETNAPEATQTPAAASPQTPAAPPDNVTQKLTIEDFYPRTADQLMYYEGEAVFNRVNDSGEYYEDIREMYIVGFQDYVSDTKNQYRMLLWVDGKQSASVEVYEISGGQLRINYTQGNFYDHTDVLDEEPNTDLVILQEPMEVGTKWIRFQSGSNVETAEIIGMNAEITVPYGTFNAMVVEVLDEVRGEKSLEYYVEGLGCVLIEQESPGKTQYQRLTDVEEGPMQDTVQMFYEWYVALELDENGGEHYFMRPNYDQVEIEYHTNEDVYELYMDMARTYLKEKYDYDVDPDVKINFVQYDRFEGLLHVDMSAAFLTEMAKTGDNETTYLQLFADTIGYIYNAFEVSISIDGGAYVSDNVTVDYAAGDYILMSMYKNAEDMIK